MLQKYAFVCLITGLVSTGALACPGGSYALIEDAHQSVRLGATGLTTVIKGEAMKLEHAISTIHVDANPGFTGNISSDLPGGSSYKIKLVSQSRDQGGIMSSTYDIIKSNSSMNPPVEETKRYKIKSNYYGNGLVARGGCGSVEEILLTSE